MEIISSARASQRAASYPSTNLPFPGGGPTGMGVNDTVASQPGQTATSWPLHRVLMTGDGVAMFIGFAIPLLALADRRPDALLYGLLCASVITVGGLYAMRLQGLWLDRVISVRAIEVSKIGRALVMVSLLALVLDRKSMVDLRMPRVLAAMTVGWLVIVMWRSAYRAFVAAGRRQGRWITRVILIGTDRRALDLHRLFGIHPELGMRVTAVVGNRREARAAGMGELWRANYVDAGAVVAAIEAEAVIISSADIDPILAGSLTREEHARRRSVYVDPGLSGFDIRRFRATHIAHQPLLEVDSMSLEGLQHVVKRLFDVSVAAAIALLAAPLLVVIAALIKLEDGGPVLFRQERVGRHGHLFGIYKFRTMVTNAEQLLLELEKDNERRGPLFKMERDPRITRIGRFLRGTSLDELPQVFNVLMGTMSLVGPRPALPSEVQTFDDVLKTRHQVRPGITGLWQVEARDNPEFDAYRRLDLFYVENWSLALDMVILLGTIDHIVFRPLVKWRFPMKAAIVAQNAAVATPVGRLGRVESGAAAVSGAA